MKRLSLPVEDIKPHYTMIVIGSGYGGAIAASRFARAGKDVCVLERGREFMPGEFPNTQAEVNREVQAHLPEADLGSRTGLYDFHVNRDINVLVGCGLGGTSLINAGIMLMPDERVFADPCWPAALRKDLKTTFRAGLERASDMLRPQTYADSYPLEYRLRSHPRPLDLQTVLLQHHPSFTVVVRHHQVRLRVPHCSRVRTAQQGLEFCILLANVISEAERGESETAGGDQAAGGDVSAESVVERADEPESDVGASAGRLRDGGRARRKGW